MQRVLNVPIDEKDIEIELNGTVYTIREIAPDEYKIVDRSRRSHLEDPDHPEDGRILTKEQTAKIFRQAAAIFASRRGQQLKLVL